MGSYLSTRFICLEELCKLCHISKRKAKWLLDNEIIPCVRSGNKRHRYKIKLSDATAFQKDQESDCVIYTYPKGQFSSKRKRESSRAAYIRRMASIIRTEKGQTALRSFYQKEFAKEPDCLYARDVVALTGFSVSSVRAWITAGDLKAYSYGIHRTKRISDRLRLFQQIYLCSCTVRKTARNRNALSKDLQIE